MNRQSIENGEAVAFADTVHLFRLNPWLLELIRQVPFAGKVMSLLFNILSRFVIALLPRSKCLLISWFHAGVQLQQPGIQPEEMNDVGYEAASQFSWTAYLFQV